MAERADWWQDEARAMYQAGVPVTAIARKFRRTYQSVYAVVKRDRKAEKPRNGISQKRVAIGFTQAQVVAISNLARASDQSFSQTVATIVQNSLDGVLKSGAAREVAIGSLPYQAVFHAIADATWRARYDHAINISVEKFKASLINELASEA